MILGGAGGGLPGSGASLSSIVESLRVRDDFTMTPFNVLYVLHESMAISVRDLQRILELFDQNMRPAASVAEIDQTGDRLFSEALAGLRQRDAGHDPGR